MKQENAYKIKLVKILEILRQDSDEDNYIETSEILSKLAAMGIVCDRRTLATDIEVLNSYGYEVLSEKSPGKPNRYCVIDRSFDVPELRILMDAVQASRFITPKKTEVLIDKIANLGGSHRSELLKSNVVKFNTTKGTNENIFYSINEINTAIEKGYKVSFEYFDFDINHNRVYRREGKRYFVNPLATIFDDDNYYLICYYAKHEDVVHYLDTYQRRGTVSKVTLDNVRRILSTFFSWLEDEDYIIKSPVRRIHKVKTGKTVKETYSDESLELMRDHCDNLRDLALIDLLASTGIRVGELVKLNRTDVDFENRECVVFGKGNKQRKVYFDARTKIHLQKYLAERTDDHDALFVSLLKPNSRLQISGVEIRLRKIGRELSMHKVHPHKFRRTLATMAIDKGMPIEQVQHLLGHQSIDTTLQYAMVNQANVKTSCKRFIG